MENQELNMEKLLEATNRYFEGNNEVNLTDLQLQQLRNVAKYDDATNNLVKCLDDAIKNNEERTIENYIAEVTNSYEMKLSEKEAQKFAQDLKKLNPDVDIKLDENCKSIDISKPVKELNLPDNFYLDENNFLTSKESTALSVFVPLKVNEITENNKNIEGEKNMKNKEKLNEEEIVVSGENKEEPKAKKRIRMPKFRLFKAIKKGFNFIKNKFIMLDDFMDEEIDLDTDTDTEELNIDIPNTDSKKECDNLNDKNIDGESISDENNSDLNNEDLNVEPSINENDNVQDCKIINESDSKSDKKSNENKKETLGSMKERYQMLGYEVEFRKNKAIMYYKEHEEEIKTGSKKQLEKYASKLSKIKELETEYSILGNKIEARRKFEAEKMDQLLNAKYEKRDNVMCNHLTNANDLEQELEYRKMKAVTYYKEHEEEIRKGSKKQLEKYALKLSKVKEVQNVYDIANTKYNSLRKEKEDSYNMLFR